MKMSPTEAKIAKLRNKWDEAVRKERHKDALAAIIELEALEPTEPRWPQRAGDTLRRLGRAPEAEQAYVRAVESLSRNGFVARAMAMAKTLVAMNPARIDVLTKLDPNAARALLPQTEAPESSLTAPTILERATNANQDEIRFEDVSGPAPIALSAVEVGGTRAAPMAVSVPAPANAPSVKPAPANGGATAPSEEPIEIAEDEIAFVPEEGPTAQELASMSACALFANLSREALTELTTMAELVECDAGALVFSRNEPADALYVLVEGSVRVHLPGDAHVDLAEGEVLGEACLLGEGLRQADVTAKTRVVALRIDKTALDGVVARHPDVDRALFELMVRRLVANLLATNELFLAFDPDTRVEISQKFEVRRARPGTTLSERGKISDALYLLLVGHLEVLERADAPAARLARGAVFGHGSLLSRAPARETIRAVSEALLLRLPASKFGTLVTAYPPALSHLAEAEASALRLSVPPGVT